jgi:hypothetical protein
LDLLLLLRKELVKETPARDEVAKHMEGVSNMGRQRKRTAGMMKA